MKTCESHAGLTVFQDTMRSAMEGGFCMPVDFFPHLVGVFWFPQAQRGLVLHLPPCVRPGVRSKTGQ